MERVRRWWARWWAGLRRGETRPIVGLVATAAIVVLLIAAAVVLPARSERPPAAVSSGPPTLEPTPAAATVPAEGTPFRLITPGPTIPAGHWRWRGQVLDIEGKPLAGVCVHIGPGDCRFNSIRTDDDGRWVIDFPQVDVMYEFHFTKDGYQRDDETIRTQGPGELNIRMVRS